MPRYLDLGAYADAKGIPYSQSSNLLSALDAALRKYEHPTQIFAEVSERAKKVRTTVEKAGLAILAPENIAAPAIMTLAMPDGLSATQLGNNLFLNGFNVHYESGYLRDRNWLQISCMNNVSNRELDNMLEVLYILLRISNKFKKGDGRFERVINN